MSKTFVTALAIAALMIVGLSADADAQCGRRASSEKSTQAPGCSASSASSASTTPACCAQAGTAACTHAAAPGCARAQAAGSCSGKLGAAQQGSAAIDLEQLGILERAAHEGSFATLMAAVEASGLAESLSGEGPYTLFAPSDEAFAKLPPGTIEALLADKERLADLLSYHVLPGVVMVEDVAKVETAKTLYGQELKVESDDRGVRVDDARILNSDIICKNGVIHVIDQVVLPGEHS